MSSLSLFCILPSTHCSTAASPSAPSILLRSRSLLCPSLDLVVSHSLIDNLTLSSRYTKTPPQLCSALVYNPNRHPIPHAATLSPSLCPTATHSVHQTHSQLHFRRRGFTVLILPVTITHQGIIRITHATSCHIPLRNQLDSSSNAQVICLPESSSCSYTGSRHFLVQHTGDQHPISIRPKLHLHELPSQHQIRLHYPTPKSDYIRRTEKIASCSSFRA